MNNTITQPLTIKGTWQTNNHILSLYKDGDGKYVYEFEEPAWAILPENLKTDIDAITWIEDRTKFHVDKPLVRIF